MKRDIAIKYVIDGLIHHLSGNYEEQYTCECVSTKNGCIQLFYTDGSIAVDFYETKGMALRVVRFSIPIRKDPFDVENFDDELLSVGIDTIVQYAKIYGLV